MTNAQFLEIKGELADIRSNLISKEAQKLLLNAFEQINDVLERISELLEIIKKEPEEEENILPN